MSLNVKETRLGADNLARKIVFEGEREAARIICEAKQRAKRVKEGIMERYFVNLGDPRPVGKAEETRECELELWPRGEAPVVMHRRLTDRGVVHPSEPY